MATTTELIKSRNLREMTFTLTYADSTAAKMLTLPANCRVVDWVINVKTAFSGGTTTISIGTTSASCNEIMTSQSVAAAGKATVTTALTLAGYEPTAQTDIYAVAGASNTAGEVDVTCVFSLQQDTPR